MKQIKFRAKYNGKNIRGSWYAAERPKNAQKIAERLVGHKLTNFISVALDFKTTMIKCEESNDNKDN